MSFLDRFVGRSTIPAAVAANALDPYGGYHGAGYPVTGAVPAAYSGGVPGAYVPGGAVPGYGYGAGIPTGVPGVPGVTSLPSTVLPGGVPTVATGVPLASRSRFGIGQGDPRFGIVSRYPIIPCCTACFLLLALILGAIGVGLPDWSTGTVTAANGVSVSRQVGLWQECGTISGTTTSSNCNDVIGQINGGNCDTLVNTIQACRGLAISGLILLLLAACYILLGGCLYNIWISAVAGCLAFIAVILLLITVILWGAVVYNQNQTCTGYNTNALINGNVCNSSNCSLGAGWILTLIATILGFLALSCTYCVCFLSRRVTPVIVPPIRPPVSAIPPPPLPPQQPVCPPSPCCAVPSSPCRPVYRFNSPPQCCPMPPHGMCPNPLGPM